MARKLSPGTHTVRIKTGKGSKTRLQRVRVNAKGQWKFLKNVKSSSSRSRVSKTSKRKKTRKRSNNPGRKVARTAKSKMLRTMSLEGGVEDIAWGFIGFTVLGKNATALPMTRTIQGLAAHALDRRGKARLVPAVLDLVTLWLAGGFGGNGGFGGGGAGVRNALSKISFL